MLTRPARFKRLLAALFIRALRIDSERLGLWHRHPNAIVVANHVSYLDGLLLAALSPTHHTFAVTRDFAASPGWSDALRALANLGLGDFASVDPASPFGLRVLLRSLRRGGGVVIFPEGGISHDGCLGQLQPGVVRLARMSGRPILPIRIDGLAQSVFGRATGAGRAWLPCVRLSVLDPLDIAGLDDLHALQLLALRLGGQDAGRDPAMTEGHDGVVSV